MITFTCNKTHYSLPLIMKYMERKLKYINQVMDSLHDLLNGIYESLVDQDYADAKEKLSEAKTVIDDITKSISDEK